MPVSPGVASYFSFVWLVSSGQKKPNSAAPAHPCARGISESLHVKAHPGVWPFGIPAAKHSLTSFGYAQSSALQTLGLTPRSGQF